MIIKHNLNYSNIYYLMVIFTYKGNILEIGFKKTACQLMGITARSYSNWSKEKRPIIDFLENNYLQKDDIVEFLETGKIEKLELIKNYDAKQLKNILNQTHTSINMPKIKVTLNLFDRVSLIYFLYLFKEEATIIDSRSLYKYLEEHLNIHDSIIVKFKKFIKNLNFTILNNDNVSFQSHIINFNKDCSRLGSDEIDYIFQHKDTYNTMISNIAEDKR